MSCACQRERGSMSEFCPSCGGERTGAFRFCRHCRFDFDAVAPEPVVAVQPIRRRSMASRLTGRQWLAAGVTLFLGLGAIGTLAKTPPPASGAQGAPGATATAPALAAAS